MAQKVVPVAVDTKTLTAMTGLSRQRLDKLRKDPTSGFPKPSRIGRSVRYFVEDVMQWLEAMKACNLELLHKMVQKNHVQQATQEVLTLCPVQRPAIKTKPTVAEVSAANKKTCSLVPSKGQRCVGNPIETADGLPAMYFRLIPRLSTDHRGLGLTHAIIPHRTDLVAGPAKTMPSIAHERPTAISADPVAFNSSAIALTDARTDSGEVGAAPTRTVTAQELKLDYESGLNLDALCTRHHIGKSKASKLLREAGTKIRKPGRPIMATNKSDTATAPVNQRCRTPIAENVHGASK